MVFLKFLHILAMFIAVTLLVGTSIYLALVARRGDRTALVKLWRLKDPVERAGILFIVLGFVFGVATAITGQLDLTAPWLLIAYAIFAAMFVIGAYEGSQWSKIIRAAEADIQSGEASGSRALDTSRVELIGYLSVVGYVAIIFDMVVKPFS